MIIEIEMWAYFVLCGVLSVFCLLSARRSDMSALARNAMSASVSVLYLCGHFVDSKLSLTDHLTLLGMALFMIFLGYQAWKSGSSATTGTKMDDWEVGNS